MTRLVKLPRPEPILVGPGGRPLTVARTSRPESVGMIVGGVGIAPPEGSVQ